MKIFSLIFFLIFTSLHAVAQTKNIAIQVDVLGKKHPTVRYYHPINGVYTISPPRVNIKKSTLKDFTDYVFINPAAKLHDSLNYIQANSLRHYVDPAELIYIDWQMGTDTLNYACLDTFSAAAEKIRTEKYQKIVQAYFNPFFISKFEVTNYQYRQFVNWVKDSIFREAIYASNSITDEQAFQMLDQPQEHYYNEEKLEWERTNTSDRKLNRELYSLNFDFDYRKEIKDEIIIPIISQFYFHPNERYYKRRVLDPSHFNYHYYSIDMKTYYEEEKKDSVKKRQNSALRGHKDRSRFIVNHNLNIYPDTACWQQFDRALFSEITGNMYFWHPAFDDMPVIGISHEQAKAYCDWKQKQLQKSNPIMAWIFTYSLPNLMEYEWAVGSGYHHAQAIHIQDNELVSDLYLGDKNETERPRNFVYDKSNLQEVYHPYDIQNVKAHKHFLKMEKNRLKNLHYKHHGSTNEFKSRAQQNYLANGIEFLSNNASEWMSEDYQTHYAELFEAYVNYKCFSDPTYCENQRNIDQNFDRLNDKNGHLIIGGNWYDERYESIYGVNTGGLYAKRFKSKATKEPTVGFRLVIRMNPPISQN